MPPQAFFALLIVIGLPIAWLFAEFGKHRALRIALGIASIAASYGFAFIIGCLSELNYNAWYGSASQDLIETTIEQIEEGHLDRVMPALRQFKSNYYPTYENRANYDDLVKTAIEQMKGNPDVPALNGQLGK